MGCFFLDIQLCPSRSDDYIPKLYYETNKFSAFDQLWTIKAKVIGNEKCATRSLSYQLILKGKRSMFYHDISEPVIILTFLSF